MQDSMLGSRHQFSGHHDLPLLGATGTRFTRTERAQALSRNAMVQN